MIICVYIYIYIYVYLLVVFNAFTEMLGVYALTCILITRNSVSSYIVRYACMHTCIQTDRLYIHAYYLYTCITACNVKSIYLHICVCVQVCSWWFCYVDVTLPCLVLAFLMLATRPDCPGTLHEVRVCELRQQSLGQIGVRWMTVSRNRISEQS